MQSAYRSFNPETTTLSPSEDPTERVQFRRELRQERRVRRDQHDRASKKLAVKNGHTFEIPMPEPWHWRFDDECVENAKQRMYRLTDEAAAAHVEDALHNKESVQEIVTRHYGAVDFFEGPLFSDEERGHIGEVLSANVGTGFTPGDVVSSHGWQVGKWLVIKSGKDEITLVAISWYERRCSMPTCFDVVLGKSLPGRNLVACADAEIVLPTAFVEGIFVRVGWVAPTELDDVMALYDKWKRGETTEFYLTMNEEQWLQRADLLDNELPFVRSMLRAWRERTSAQTR